MLVVMALILSSFHFVMVMIPSEYRLKIKDPLSKTIHMCIYAKKYCVQFVLPMTMFYALFLIADLIPPYFPADLLMLMIPEM